MSHEDIARLQAVYGKLVERNQVNLDLVYIVLELTNSTCHLC